MRQVRDQMLWDDAGLVTERGELTRELRATEIHVPEHVRIEGDRLVWRNEYGRKVRPRQGMLEEFVDLSAGTAMAEPERIAKYARRWGVLGLCGHGLPRTHNPDRERPPQQGCRLLVMRHQEGELLPEYWEPLSVWDAVSRRTRALLNVAAHLHGGKRGKPDDWHVLLGVDRPPSDVKYARWRLARRLNDWLEYGDVRPAVVWEPNGPALRIRVSGLFGALAMQLVLAIAKTNALAICSGCGTSFPPKRKPVDDRRRYCDDCRDKGIPIRDAMADRRRRQREQREVRGGEKSTR